MVAKIVKGKVYSYPALKATKSKKTSSTDDRVSYSFDITKADQIFDYLLKVKQIRLLDGYRIPSVEEHKDNKDPVDLKSRLGRQAWLPADEKPSVPQIGEEPLPMAKQRVVEFNVKEGVSSLRITMRDEGQLRPKMMIKPTANIEEGKCAEAVDKPEIPESAVAEAIERAFGSTSSETVSHEGEALDQPELNIHPDDNPTKEPQWKINILKEFPAGSYMPPRD
ncbi:hypothetical protein K7X08_002877 [Anisodus acutangulus]|uniref:Uncharacterized protein n=1 Tax=Anisodus acutangulus TaxID=402998 RepID=A0A9Q1MHQ3_9SOLA|nr:hypothetical protein K7X08_002877 [Anisodus acutangulus]